MSADRKAAWSPGAAGPVLRLAGIADPHDADWWDFAACAGIPTDQFYPEPGQGNRYLKKVCAGCPVRPQCLDYALSLREHDDWGVWGGMSEQRRREIRRRRRREDREAA